MRSPRRMPRGLPDIDEAVTPPPDTSLFWTMWKANVSTASDALGTDFVQGIGKGTLDPVTYGGFNVNDAYYCFNAAGDYLAAASRTSDQALKRYLLTKYEGYEKYNKEFVDVWRVRDASGVVPYQAAVEYSEFESTVASHEDPIYALIVMIPCEYLWAWLANELAPPKQGNLYAPWITGNDDFDGSYKMGNFLDAYMAANPGVVDPQHATDLYGQAMSYELANFQAATAGG